MSNISPISDDIHIHQSMFPDIDRHSYYEALAQTSVSLREDGHNDSLNPRGSISQRTYKDGPASVYSNQASSAQPPPLDNIIPDYLLGDYDIPHFSNIANGEAGDRQQTPSKDFKSPSSRRSSLSAKMAVTPYRDWYDRRNMSRIFRAQRSPAARRSLIQNSVEVHEQSESGQLESCRSLIQGDKSASFRYLAAFQAALDGNSMDLMASRTAATGRFYSTSVSSPRSFYYKYGTPLVKCTVLASATTMAWQLLWQNLEYQEYRDEAEQQITALETRIKSLEVQKQPS
ncbi:hypothetical protein DFQ28_004200 [Apophysomyces sp. BC1034]|nr:hypothetical protein DFQ29_003401 [Apophysomyces sp. BC1021]KAG0188890.1 hypothetical protein DFQ28_004200 [Apophysomyces sp. BC1034]